MEYPSIPTPVLYMGGLVVEVVEVVETVQPDKPHQLFAVGGQDRCRNR